MVDSALLILGFSLDDWNFRVLFRSIMAQEGNLLGDYSHVAVQIDPEDSRIADPERARVYFESQFKGVEVTIYWGNVDNFITQLKDHWNDEYPDALIN
jgi:hypothetical protein